MTLDVILGLWWTFVQQAIVKYKRKGPALHHGSRDCIIRVQIAHLARKPILNFMDMQNVAKLFLTQNS